MIVLAAWIFNNVRTLLLSKLGQPYDPVTGTGTVGRNYAYQVGGGGATGWFKSKKFKRYMGAGGLQVTMDDLGADNFDHSALGFIGGGVIGAGQTGARPIQNLSVPPGTAPFGRRGRPLDKMHDGVGNTLPIEAPQEPLPIQAGRRHQVLDRHRR